MISKDDFKDWKSNPVTKAVSAGLEARLSDIKDILGNTAGDDPLRDRYHVGYIQSILDYLDIKMEDIPND